MEDKPKEYGRTFFDFISEHPRKTFFSFLALIIILGFFVFTGNSIKIGEFEFNVQEKVIRDTIVKIKRDTIKIEVPKIVTKYIERPSEQKSTKVKTDKADIDVKNQPTNINTGSNSGIIGNNNTVNFSEKPIVLNETDKKELIRLIKLESKKIPSNKPLKIEVDGLLGNSRSTQLAQIIFDYLKSQGYDVGKGINQYVPSAPDKGVVIYIENDSLHVKVLIV